MYVQWPVETPTAAGTDIDFRAGTPLGWKVYLHW